MAPAPCFGLLLSHNILVLANQGYFNASFAAWITSS
jgi:hypothetical protein